MEGSIEGPQRNKSNTVLSICPTPGHELERHLYTHVHCSPIQGHETHTEQLTKSMEVKLLVSNLLHYLYSFQVKV